MFLPFNYQKTTFLEVLAGVWANGHLPILTLCHLLSLAPDRNSPRLAFLVCKVGRVMPPGCGEDSRPFRATCPEPCPTRRPVLRTGVGSTYPDRPLRSPVPVARAKCTLGPPFKRPI